MSHAAIWQRVLDDGHDFACIMEDDIVLAPDFRYWLERIEQYPLEFDILKLEAIARHKCRIGTVVKCSDRWQIAQCWFAAAGAACYIISRQGAQRLLAYEMPISAPVDTAMLRYWENSIRTFEVLPYLARQRGVDVSTIQAAAGPPRKFRYVHYNPLDWKPLVYTLSAWRRWKILGFNSLRLQSIKAHDALLGE